MSGRPITEVFSVLPLVIFKTHFGNVLMIRLTGLALAWLGWLWRSRSFQSRTSLILMLATVALIAASRSASGHAANAGDFTLVEIVDWLHIFMVSTWGGALVLVSLVILLAISTFAAQLWRWFPVGYR